MFEENELIQKLRNGQEEAFEFIFKTYFHRLCKYAQNIVKSKDISEEIVEDFFLNLWENCHSIEINISIRSYFYRSIHNKCLKYLRHLKVEQNYFDQLQYTVTDIELHQPLSTSYPIANLISKELEELTENAIRSLPDQCRKIFCLQRFNDLTYPEIAEKLGISINTVKTQMVRALQKLRESLKDYLPTLILILSFIAFA